MEYKLDQADTEALLEMEERIYNFKNAVRSSLEALMDEKNKLLKGWEDKYGIENIHLFYIDLAAGRLKLSRKYEEDQY